MLKFLTKGYWAPVLFSLLFVVSLTLSFLWGRSDTRQKLIEQEAIEFQDTTDAINRGLNEVRQANPSRDASIALERLRERQLER